MERLRARQQAAHRDAYPRASSCADSANMCCPEVSSASDTSAISPTHAGPLSSRSLASNLLASLRRHRIPPTPRKLPGVVRAAEPTCSSGPTHRATTGVSMRSSRHFLIPTASRAREDVIARLRPPVSSVRSCDLIAHSWLACNSRNYPHVRIYLPCCRIQAGSSSLFAATATAFLLVPLSKMPRSISRTPTILPRAISDQG